MNDQLGNTPTGEKTKEEIALKYVPCRCDEIYTSRGLAAPDCSFHSTDPESAMDEWAEIIAVGFVEWCAENAEAWLPKGESLYWVLLIGDENDNSHFTTVELYTLYLQSLSGNK